MNKSSNPMDAKQSSRREFIKNTSKVTAASALASVALPHVHAQSSETVQVALIGCGGRGTGAAANALSVSNGPTKLVAMADVFQHRLDGSFNTLNKRYEDKMEVPIDRQFIGFDAYKHAIDALNPGDVAIFTTPLAFRWVHFTYAIEKGVNVFMEKPLTADGPTTRRMIALADKATEKNLKVGVGLMVRHCRARQELYKRIQDGEIGDILNMRAYRMHGPVGSAFSGPNPGNMSDLMYQISRFHSFLWASGGLFNDFYIHQVDECCWMKNDWPIKAHALGGRHYRDEEAVDQNFDNYAVEYTFKDGSKFQLNGRTMIGCHDNFASYVHGTKGLGIVSTSSHSPGRCRTFNGQNMSRRDMIWAFPQPEQNPYQLEWDDLLDAIRNDKPYNEVKRGATASLVSSMGRMAAHTGQEITYDQIYNHDHEFAPNADKLTLQSDAPLAKNPDGRYPIPQPGIVRDREYQEAASA
ncbi:MAG: Gfo/Idh/MocA family oxidoreductase [Verrucomicrobia bacterium]|jgi:predicted dehydrogenase|nr:Gfo/Idh/MocA family oxidoreductase [Verrucomicrobiota bacterium]